MATFEDSMIAHASVVTDERTLASLSADDHEDNPRRHSR
jgi:hypothetical protein